MSGFANIFDVVVRLSWQAALLIAAVLLVQWFARRAVARKLALQSVAPGNHPPASAAFGAKLDKRFQCRQASRTGAAGESTAGRPGPPANAGAGCGSACAGEFESRTSAGA